MQNQRSASNPPPGPDYLALPDEQLLAQCDVNITKAPGPGGQHRNKVSSAVRLRHRPTGIGAQGHERRSQHENRAVALHRLRMAIACQCRRPLALPDPPIPPAVRSCLVWPRSAEYGTTQRLEVSAHNKRYWPVVAFLLDLLEAAGGRLAEAAGALNVSSSNFLKVLEQDRHAHAAAQDLRRRHSLGPLK